MSESESKGGKGKWAAIVTIATALLTSLTSIAIAVITSGSIDYRLKEESAAHDKQVEASATGAAVDVLWLKERVQQLEGELAVEQALRAASEKRLDRMEDRLFRRGSGRRPTDASRTIDMDGLVAKAKEELKKKRPPKPNAKDARVQRKLEAYLGKKK